MRYIMLEKVKRGKRLAGMPPRDVKTFIPQGWDKDSTKAYAEAVETWRKNR